MQSVQSDQQQNFVFIATLSFPSCLHFSSPTDKKISIIFYLALYVVVKTTARPAYSNAIQASSGT
jgi:hypothetical protein